MNQITYPYLPEGRTIKFVSITNPFMSEAKKVSKEQSSDRKQPTGAVVVRDGAVIGRGANMAVIRNAVVSKFHKDFFCVRRFLKIRSGEKYWLCPGCVSSRNHAETRATLDAINKTDSAEGADLYLWGHWWCCKPCWDSMLKGGIKDVYLLEGSDIYFNSDNPQNVLGQF